MAVEIRELVIKAVIADGNEGEDSPGGHMESDRDQLIQECVDQVLKIMKKTKNR